MITLSLAIEDKSLWDEAHSCLREESVRIDFEQSNLGGLGSFMAGLERSNSDLVLIDISVLRPPLEEIIRKIRLATPASMIVAMNTTAATGPVLECFRAGADEYLFPPLADGLKKALVRRETEKRKSESRQPAGNLVAFLSAKGGCGATTLACHVAKALMQLEQSVLLADLDVGSGMVAFIMKSKSPYSIAEALNNVHRLDVSYWKALVSTDIQGLDIISAPAAMAARHEPKMEEIRQVLGFAHNLYRWTVADIGRSISQSTMTALDAADQTCLVTTPEIPALHQAKQILQKLLDGGYKKERLRLVLNRVPKRSGIRPEEVQEMLGVALFAVIPECYAELHEAYSQGQLLPSGTEMGKTIARFASKLAGVEEQTARRKVPFFG